MEIHLWECMLPCMFRTLATNFQDGSWIYRLMVFKSKGMQKVFSQTGLHQEYTTIFIRSSENWSYTLLLEKFVACW